VAIIDVGSRKTLSWRVSNHDDAGLLRRALQEALGNTGNRDLNTDGVSVTSGEWIDTLKRPEFRSAWTAKGADRQTCLLTPVEKCETENIYLRPTRTERSCDED